MAHLPLSEKKARGHANAGYLTVVNRSMLNQWLQAVTKWLGTDNARTLTSVRIDTRGIVVGLVAASAEGPGVRIGITVDSHGRIADLDIGPTIGGPVPFT